MLVFANIQAIYFGNKLPPISFATFRKIIEYHLEKNIFEKEPWF